MVSIAYMRDVVANKYPQNRDWKRCVDRMPDGQVMAIYNKTITKPSTKPKDYPNEDPQLPF